MNARQIAQALEELGIDRESHRVLALLPLVYVAWADGRVQRAERSLILRIGMEKGWLTGRGAEILERWLSAAPSAEEVRKGLGVLGAFAGLERGFGARAVSHDTLLHLVSYCRDVAEAAGGVFGLGAAVTGPEEEALAAIARAFDLQGGKTWQDLVAEADAHAHRAPPGPRGHFLLGMMPDMMSDPLGTLMRAAREHGDVVRICIPGLSMVLVWRPEHLEHVLIENKDNYQRGRDYDVLATLVGKSLLTTDGEPWRKLRRMSQPAFHHKALAPMADVIVAQADRTLERWQSARLSGAPIDVAAEMMRMALGIIGLLTFSTDLSDESSAIAEAVHVALTHAQSQMNNPLRLPGSFPTPQNLRFRKALGVFDELIYGKIAERRRSTGQEPRDLLGLLLAARDDESGEALSDQELRNELLTFLVAGHETTALALTWTLYLLSKSPTVARQMRAEAAAVLGRDRPTLERARELGLTHRVVDESMRLFPPAPIVGRTAMSEDEIGGYRVAAGTDVVLSPWVTHRIAEVWPNPEGFDPDRFLPAETEKRHRCAYLPFILGPHKCIGAPLSMMELHLVLPMIVRRYRLDLVAGFEPGLEAAITLRPRNGMQMTVHDAG
jgi:cytochrome P450